MSVVIAVALWVGIGGVSGVLTHVLLRRGLEMGLEQTISLCVLGALAGGALGAALDHTSLEEFLTDPLRIGTVLLPIFGALVVMSLVAISTRETE